MVVVFYEDNFFCKIELYISDGVRNEVMCDDINRSRMCKTEQDVAHDEQFSNEKVMDTSGPIETLEEQ